MLAELIPIACVEGVLQTQHLFDIYFPCCILIGYEWPNLYAVIIYYIFEISV